MPGCKVPLSSGPKILDFLAQLEISGTSFVYKKGQHLNGRRIGLRKKLKLGES